MGDLDVSQIAPVEADGAPADGSYTVVSADQGIATIIGVDGVNYIDPQTAGTVEVTVTKGGRTGSKEVVIDAAPIVVTIGTPIPKS